MHDNARRTAPVTKALRLKSDSQTAVRLADVVRIPQKAGMEFVDKPSRPDLGIAEGEHLRLADGQRVETRNAGATLAARIRVVQAIIIEEIVAVDLAEARIGIDPAASLCRP